MTFRSAAPRKKKPVPAAPAPARAPAPKREATFDDIAIDIQHDVEELAHGIGLMKGVAVDIDEDTLDAISDAVAKNITALDLETKLGKLMLMHDTKESRISELAENLERTTNNAKDVFENTETVLDGLVASLRALERKHPEISGYDFDDMVRAIENASDDMRNEASDAADALTEM